MPKEGTPSALNKDKVTLVLGGTTIGIATSFSITQSLLKQPAEFSMRLGRGTADYNAGKGPTIRELIKAAPPNTPFQLYINDNLRMTGYTDGYRATAAGGAASELTIFGRDTLAPLHDAHIHHEISFNNKTYKSLVEEVLKIVGYKNFKLDATGAGPRADRSIKAGISVRELLPVRTVQEILDGKGEGQTAGASGGSTTQSTLQSKIGERWMDFLRKQLDRAGLFLWAGGDGTIFLSAPNPNLAPTYRITRRRGQTRNDVNVIHADILNDKRPRYSYVVVYGKHGGKKNGVQKSKGDGEDKEMIGYGYDLARALAVRDKHVQNAAQAAYLAQRKLAEGRRHGFQLVYTMSGLSTPAIGGGNAVWTPDTVVEIVDDEFGIDSTTPGGNHFWIDQVDFGRAPHTTSTIRLMRPYDVVFGTPDFEGSGVQTGFPKTPKPKPPQDVKGLIATPKGPNQSKAPNQSVMPVYGPPKK
jgi:prophage tail gpP-like protein